MPGRPTLAEGDAGAVLMGYGRTLKQGTAIKSIRLIGVVPGAQIPGTPYPIGESMNSCGDVANVLRHPSF